MNFAALILAAFFAGLGLGYVKFFALNYLSNAVYHTGDRVWIIQVVGALITVGPFLAYILAAPLATAYRKSSVMRKSSAAVAVILLSGNMIGWLGTTWLYVFLTGAIMGVFNSAKNAAVPLESAQSGRPTELVTATLCIVYVAGILAGAPFGTEYYIRSPYAGAATSVLIFLLAATAGGMCSYKTEDSHLAPFRSSVVELISDTRWLFVNYWIYVVAVPMIWGVASAASLAVTAYAEERMLGSAVKCSLMAAYATVGVILGNVLSVKLRRIRHLAASVCSIGLVIVVISIPLIVELLHPSNLIEENNGIYLVVALDLALFGLLFGTATNLMEAEYLSLVYNARKEGTGASLMSAMTAFFPFIMGGAIALAVIFKLADPVTQFAWLAFITAVPAALIVVLFVRKRRSKEC